MAILAALMLTTAACLLGSTAQEDYKPSRQIPIILSDTCLPEEQLSERATEDGISETLGVIAPTLAAGRARGSCLDYIYMLAYTSELRYSDASHPHNFEVVVLNETREITLPVQAGDYERHRGDIWKLSIKEDLLFPAGSCVRVCNIDSVAIVEGGNNGWNIDSVVTFGCITGAGCKQITQDMDVLAWVDGNTAGYERLPLTKISNTPCAF